MLHHAATKIKPGVKGTDVITICYEQVLKGLHGGVREVALKMLLDVEDPEKELARFTKVLFKSLWKIFTDFKNGVQCYAAQCPPPLTPCCTRLPGST